MATEVRAQVVFLTESGLPEDVVINTFHFRKLAGDFDDPDFALISSNLNSFYTAGHDTQDPIQDYMAGYLEDATDPFVYFYDFNAQGSPIGMGQLISFNVNENATSLPAEVAICASFHGDLSAVVEVVPLPPAGPEGDQRPRARRRGRVFIGPLNTTVLSTAVGARSRVEPGAQDAIVAAMVDLELDFVSTGIEWCVASRVSGVFTPVVGGWVDNEFDTQRRRGSEATVRDSWAA